MILIFIKKVLQFATKYGKIQTFGALAQLGERYTGSVEVSGSIPLCSTNVTLDPIRFGSGVIFCTFYRV